MYLDFSSFSMSFKVPDCHFMIDNQSNFDYEWYNRMAVGLIYPGSKMRFGVSKTTLLNSNRASRYRPIAC